MSKGKLLRQQEDALQRPRRETCPVTGKLRYLSRPDVPTHYKSLPLSESMEKTTATTKQRECACGCGQRFTPRIRSHRYATLRCKNAAAQRRYRQRTRKK